MPNRARHFPVEIEQRLSVQGFTLFLDTKRVGEYSRQ